MTFSALTRNLRGLALWATVTYAKRPGSYSPKTPCYVEVPFLHEMGRELRSRAENWFIRLQIALRVFLA